MRRLEPFNDKRPYASVLFLGDIHWGSPQCDRERVKRQIDYCRKERIHILLMGDLVENATRDSVGAGVYEQIMNPQDQQDEVIGLLKPLANKGLLLGLLHGNHEDRTYKSSGVNPSKIIADALSVPYLGSAGWNLFRVGGQNYKVYALHGATGSRYLHTKLSSLFNISHSFDADLIAMGHIHEIAQASILVQRINLRNKVVEERKKHLILTGHYLSYTGGYGQAQGMPIGKMGSPKVKFFSDKYDIHIST